MFYFCFKLQFDNLKISFIDFLSYLLMAKSVLIIFFYPQPFYTFYKGSFDKFYKQSLSKMYFLTRPFDKLIWFQMFFLN